MPTERTNQQGPERARTDESLRTERKQADRAFADRQSTVESEADEVVDRARDNADAVLLEARTKEDRELGRAARHPDARAVVAEARAVHDRALRTERESADEVLQRQREESARALSTLLPLERERTDRYLLSERRRSDDALSSRDDFLGIVSHDLRNLLGGIVMSASLLAESAADEDVGETILSESARIQRYAARMNRLISDLVDVASIDAGQLAVTPVPGDLHAVVAEAVDTFHAAAEAKGISLETELAGAPILGSFDHDRIFQVLANLLSNAIKFTPEGGRISIGGERTSDVLRVSIADTGVGIPAEMLEQVFERFWQVGKNDRRGSGLGLYISRCIVEAHGGTITATSSLGVGSVFSFTLPVSGAAAR